ncbi:hypothetical protein EMCRGX_G030528, partial [Ephydatia muelleri]
ISEVKVLGQRLNLDVFCYTLQEFDTEIDFCTKISTVFAKRDSRKETLLIIQCESGHLYSDLIACAHYKVHDVLDRAQRSSSMDSNSMTHVLFIVNLPSNLHNQCNFVGFQGDLWISLHLDELWPVDESNFDIHAISEYTMSEMFIGQKLNHPEHISPQHQ